jgi:purine-nucleoside phosphorylase
MEAKLMTPYEKIIHCYDQIRAKTDFQPKVALVLGSGLGNFADKARIVATVNYSDIEGFPVSTVQGHSGRFIFGYIGDVPVVMMQGRVHYYEGYDIKDVVMPIRIMGLLGAKSLILTNAAGGVDPTFKPGTIMLITDHISCFVPSPLMGKNIEELGTRFPDMTAVYDKEYRGFAIDIAKNMNLDLRQGVYVQLSGPNYETPAEINMVSRLGANAVGMSTVCEAMAARHMGLRVCGVSCITNMAAGLNATPLTHTEVAETAAKVEAEFSELMYRLIERIGE